MNTVYDVLFSRNKRKRLSLDGVFLSIAGVLRWLNRNYNDTELRGRMGEWTKEEAREAIFADHACQQKNEREGYAWSDIWHEGGG